VLGFDGVAPWLIAHVKAIKRFGMMSEWLGNGVAPGTAGMSRAANDGPRALARPEETA
jgi:hypothetical protein